MCPIHGLPIGGKVDFAHAISKTEVQKSNSVRIIHFQFQIANFPWTVSSKISGIQRIVKSQSKKANIQKTGLACWKIPQTIQIFRKIVFECENYQFCNVLRKDQQAYLKTKVS